MLGHPVNTKRKDRQGNIVYPFYAKLLLFMQNTPLYFGQREVLGEKLSMIILSMSPQTIRLIGKAEFFRSIGKYQYLCL